MNGRSEEGYGGCGSCLAGPLDCDGKSLTRCYCLMTVVVLL